MRVRHTIPAIGLLLLAGAAAAQAPSAPAQPPAAPQAPLERQRVVRGEATVQSVDQATRVIVLRGQDGRLATVTAGPEVRNLAQVRAGDRVVIEYRDALALEMAPPGSSAAPEAAQLAGRTEPGQRPGVVTGEAVRLRVRIVSINPEDGRVTFETPGGIRSIVPQDPRVRAFAAGLRPGDEVDVTWVEALAITVQPARRR